MTVGHWLKGQQICRALVEMMTHDFKSRASILPKKAHTSTSCVSQPQPRPLLQLVGWPARHGERCHGRLCRHHRDLSSGAQRAGWQRRACGAAVSLSDAGGSFDADGQRLQSLALHFAAAHSSHSDLMFFSGSGRSPDWTLTTVCVLNIAT